jgi:His/Glu/Gln/Arg/opine family amino acid ABC transporter permease subunit
MGGALMFQTYGLVQAEYLVEAMRWTASLAAMAMLGGAIGGALMVALRLSNALIPRTVGRAVTYVAQGTPLLVQLFLAYFGASAIGLDVPPLAAAAFAFTLWASAFLGDIWCGAIETVPKGQREARSACAPASCSGAWCCRRRCGPRYRRPWGSSCRWSRTPPSPRSSAFASSPAPARSSPTSRSSRCRSS